VRFNYVRFLGYGEYDRSRLSVSVPNMLHGHKGGYMLVVMEQIESGYWGLLELFLACRTNGAVELDGGTKSCRDNQFFIDILDARGF
jgi:hypothetical protein